MQKKLEKLGKSQGNSSVQKSGNHVQKNRYLLSVHVNEIN